MTEKVDGKRFISPSYKDPQRPTDLAILQDAIERERIIQRQYEAMLADPPAGLYQASEQPQQPAQQPTTAASDDAVTGKAQPLYIPESAAAAEAREAKHDAEIISLRQEIDDLKIQNAWLRKKNLEVRNLFQRMVELAVKISEL